MGVSGWCFKGAILSPAFVSNATFARVPCHKLEEASWVQVIYVFLISATKKLICRASLYEKHISLICSEILSAPFPPPSLPNSITVTSFNRLSVSHIQESTQSLKPLIKGLEDIVTLLGMQIYYLSLYASSLKRNQTNAYEYLALL